MYHWRQTGIQMSLRSAGLMALLAFGANASGQVNPTAPVADEVGVATVEQEGFSGGVSLNGTYFDVRHQANSGVGYQKGFTQFGAFAPIWGSDNWYVAPNVRMILTDDAATGFNAGLVARTYSDRFDRIFGVNAYYDDDQSVNKNRYTQFGFGAESLGRIIDVRANGYLPTDTDSNFIRATGLSSNLVFFENRLGFIGTQLTEQSLTGGDAEVGVPLAPDMPWLRGYVGGYAYRQNDGSTPVGFRGRVEGWVTNDLSLGAMVTSDSLFGTNVNFMIDWRFAGFQPTRYFPNWSTRDRMLMPVQRNWRISTVETQEQVNIAADNPRKITAGETDPRYFVVWVDPDATAANPGTGTYEDPLHTLPPTVPGQTDMVMVLRGDSATTPLSGPITLPDFARMLGQGHEHTVSATATFGPFTQTVTNEPVPDARFTNTGLYPFLTNPGGNIVNVGNHNEVAAFVMQNATGAAIAGTNTNGFHFHHLEITGNNGGIVLTGAQGSGLITQDGQSILGGQITDINRNLVDGLNAAGLGNNGVPGGINITTGVANLGLNLERISMNSDPGLQDYGIRLRTDQGRLVVNMQDIETSNGNAVAGVSIEQNTGRIDADIDSLTSNFNNGVGLRLLSGNLRPMNVIGTNVTADDNVGDNLQIANNPVAGAPFNSTFDASFTDSTFDRSTAGSGISLNMSNGIKSLSLTNVSASNNFLNGVGLAATGGTLNLTADALTASGNTGTNLNIGTTNANFVGNITSVAGNSVFDDSTTGSGIVLTATGGTASLNLDTIFSRDNFADGLRINALGGAQIGNSANAIFDGVNVHDSTLTGNGGMAINQFVAGGSHLEVFVDPTDLSNSGLHNSRFEVIEGSTFVALYDQTTLDNSGTDPLALELGRGRGIFGLVDGANSVANVTVTNSSIVGSANDGVYLGTSNSAVANLTLTSVNVQDNGQSTAGASGVELAGASGSTINLTLDGTTVLNNTAPGGPAAFGLTVGSAGVGTNVNVTATGTNFDNAGTNAVKSTISGGGTVFFEFDNTSGTNGDGLNVIVNAGSTFNACLEDSHFDNFSGAGLRITTTGAGAISNIHMENSSADGNDLGGLVANVLLGGELNFRAVNSTFDDNGTALGLTDGVFVSAANTGSIARLLFSQSSASDNLGDNTLGHGNGFNFEASDGATMTARIDRITATGNAGYGVRLDAQDAGTNAILIPEGANEFVTPTPNTLGSYSINYNGTDFAVVALTGSFNSQPGNGVDVNITNVGSALVTLTGDGTDTISNNLAGHGVNIIIDTADSAGILIQGYSDISNNGFDGVHIELTDITTAAAVELQGPTNLTNNGQDGVDITLTNVVLGTYAPPAALDPLSVLTLTDDLNAPLDCLPKPVDVAFSDLVPSPTANGILIDQYNISRVGAAAPAGQDGISINGISSVTGTGLVTLTSNTITNYNNGINATFAAASSFGGVVIDDAIIDNSSASGIAVSMNASGAPITITNSAITDSGSNGINVALTGATGSFDIDITDTTVQNSAGRGVSVSGNGAIGDVTLDTVSSESATAGEGVAVVFNTAGTTVGAINLTGVSANNSSATGILVDLNGISVGSPIALTGGTNSFSTNNGGDGIRINLTNLATAPDVSVTGYQLGGAAGIDNNAGHGIAVIASGTTSVGDVDISSNIIDNSTAGDGIRLVLVNNAGDVTLDSNNVDNSFGDGIRLALDGVTGGDVSTTNSDIDNSGANGINFTAVGATLGTVTLDPSIVSNSQNDGVHVDLTNATIDELLVADFTISDSGLGGTGDGLEVILNGTLGSAPITVSNTAVTNSANRGVYLHGSGATLGDVTLTDVSSDTTTVNEGVAVVFNAATTLDSISLTNVSANLSNTTGILVDLNTVTVNNSSIALTGDPASFSTNNGGDGIRVNLTTITGTPDVSITDYSTVGSIDNNAGNGIALVTNGTPVGAVEISRNTVSNSTSGDGILMNLTNSAVGSVVVDTNTISDSSNRGLNVLLAGVTGTPTVEISDVTVTDSGARGVSVQGTGSATTDIGDITLTDVSSTNAGLEGVEVIFNTAGASVGSIALNNVSSDTSGSHGIVVSLNSVAVGPSIVIDGQGTAQAINSTGDGVRLTITGVTGTPDVRVNNYLLVDQNAGNGIAVLTNGSAVGDVEVSGNIVSNSTAGDGIRMNLTNSAVGTITSASNTISDSDGRGLNLILTGVTGLPTIDLSDITVTNSGLGGVTGRGVSVAGTGSAGNQMLLGTITLTDVSSDTTGAEQGVAVVLSANAAANGKVGDITLTNVTALNSFGAGIVTSLNTMTFDPTITIDGQGTAQSTGNGTGAAGGDGILVTVDNIALAVGAAINVNIQDYLLVDDNAGRGIALESNGERMGAVTVSGNNVSNSTGTTTGQGIQLNLTNSILGSLTVDSNTIDNSADRGLDVILDGVNGGANPAPVISISSVTVTNSDGRGVSVAGTGATLGDIQLTFVSSDTTTTAGEGIAIDLDHGTVDSILLNDVTANNSFSTGILVSLDTETVGPEITVNGQGNGQVTGNGTGGTGDGILITLDTLTNTPNLSVSDFAQIGTNAGDGIMIDQVNLANVGTVSIANNIITNNDANGVAFAVTNSSQGTVTLTENQITGHTAGDGVNVVQLGDTDNLIDFDFLRNTITGNTGGRGVNLDMQYAVAGFALNADFTNDTISNNGQEGISILATNNVVATVTVNSDAGTANPISGNFNSDISGNGSFGLLINTHDTASYDLTVGGAGAQNTFNGNTDAGIGLLMNNSGNQGAVVSTFDISNVAITNTLNGANLDFDGDGVRLVIQDPASNTGTAVVRNATLGAATNNTLLGDNAGAGFGLDSMQSAIISGLTIQNSTFQNLPAAPAQLNGIDITRRNDSKLTGTTIVGNTITGHTQNGIRIDLAGGNIDIETAAPGLVTDFTIGGATAALGNTITGNTGGDTGAGINILASADVITSANIRNNNISSNTGNGILAQVDFFGSLLGTWNQNQINSNTRDGISMTGARSAAANVLMDLNTINLSGRDGVHVQTSSSALSPTFFNLGITNNTIDSSTRDGINLAATVSSTINVVNLDNNFIRLNGQDGIDLSTSGSANIGLNTLNGNTVTGRGSAVGTGNGLLAVASNSTDNTGISITSNTTSFANFGNAGVNLQANTRGALTANFTDLSSRFNGGRGVSVVTSNSTANTNGAQMNVTITGSNDPRPGGVGANSRIEENGLNGLFVENNAGNLSTANTITLTLNQTNIRGNGIAAVAPSDDDRNGVWIRAGTSTSGRINATVTSNVMSGNQNIDFVTQSFTATPNPGVTSQYTNGGGFVSDPVARLGLILGGAGVGNIGDQIDLVRNNTGANPAATYTNADSFKSPGAIFNANTRPRNAQRYETGAFTVANNDTIQAGPPAPTSTVFQGTGLNENFGGQNTLVNLSVNGNSDITGYAAATNTFTISPGLGVFAAGTNFNVVGNRISGYGSESTFRSMFGSVAAGGNTFGTVITDFGSTLPVSGGRGNFSVFNENYTWTTDVTPFVSP